MKSNKYLNILEAYNESIFLTQVCEWTGEAPIQAVCKALFMMDTGSTIDQAQSIATSIPLTLTSHMARPTSMGKEINSGNSSDGGCNISDRDVQFY